MGATTSTSEKIEDFNHVIHDLSSGNNVRQANQLQKLLAGLLRHTQDDIDSAFSMGRRTMLDRDGNPVVFMHRLLRGHDPLSVKGDNPIVILCSQYGILKGLTQVVRHLVADTFSKEGLPIPGHSFFDVRNEDGKLSNYFISVSKSLAEQSSKTDTRSVFEGVFTIHAQDILSQGLVFALCQAYIAFRGIVDSTRIRQIKIIAYGLNFFTHACVGTIRQGGIPYIHWPALVSLTKEFMGLYIDGFKEIKKLEEKTAILVQENIELEQRVFDTGASIKTYEDANDFFNSLAKEKEVFDDLTNFFEEEVKNASTTISSHNNSCRRRNCRSIITSTRDQ